MLCGRLKFVPRRRRGSQRPGHPACSHFLEYGECDYGRLCHYDHPGEEVMQDDASWEPLQESKEALEGHWKTMALCDSLLGRLRVLSRSPRLRHPN